MTQRGHSGFLLGATVPPSAATKHPVFPVTFLQGPRADGAGQTGQHLPGGRQQPAEEENSKELQQRHLQKTPLLPARHRGEKRGEASKKDPSVFRREEVE